MTQPAVIKAMRIQARECRKDHACVADRTVLCPVNYPCGNHVLHVTPVNSARCGYCVRCGPKNAFCTCPVRVDLYKRQAIYSSASARQ